jgi:hypothetical protein
MSKVSEYLEAYAGQCSPVLAWTLRALARDIKEGAHLTDSVHVHMAPYEVVEAEEKAKTKLAEMRRDFAFTIAQPRPCEFYGDILIPSDAIDPRVQLVYSVEGEAIVAQEQQAVAEKTNEERDGMGFSRDLWPEADDLRRSWERQYDAVKRLGDQLLEIEELRERLAHSAITAEEGQEIIAELTVALALQAGEALRPCAGGCPGHLGEKARLAAEEALNRWTAMEEHLRGLRERLRIECAELGDNDWPDDLNLADVVEKYLARPVAARITELEAENRRLREALPRFKAHRAEDAARAELVTRLFRDGIASGAFETLDWKAADPLRGSVVWHRHDGDLVKLAPVSETEEAVEGSRIFVSYIPGTEEIS